MFPDISKTDTYTLCVDKLVLQLRHRATVRATDTYAAAVGMDLHALGPGGIAHGSTRLELAAEYEIQNNYRRNYFVLVEGERLGYISLDSFRVVDAALISFTLSNRALYGEYVPKIAAFFADCGLEVSNVTKLELAVDTNVDLARRFRKYFKNPTGYHALFKMCAEDVDVAGKVYRAAPASLSYYPRFSEERQMKIYDKSLEIAANGKDYITSWHRANGLDVALTVYRFELTLFNKSFKARGAGYTRTDTATGEVEHITKYFFDKLPPAERATYNLTPGDGEDFTPDVLRLGDAEYLLSLLNKYGNGTHLFSKRDNNVKSRCTPVYLLRLGDAPALVPVTVPAEPIKNKNQMVTTLKTLVRHYYTTNKAEYLTTATLLANEVGAQAELDKQLERLLPLRPVLQKSAPAPSLPL